MKKTVLILSLLAFLLGGWVAALWLLPSAVYKGDCQEIRYGVNEGLELVEQDNGAKGKRYVVEDADGNELFTHPFAWLSARHPFPQRAAPVPRAKL